MSERPVFLIRSQGPSAPPEEPNSGRGEPGEGGPGASRGGAFLERPENGALARSGRLGPPSGFRSNPRKQGFAGHQAALNDR